MGEIASVGRSSSKVSTTARERSKSVRDVLQQHRRIRLQLEQPGRWNQERYNRINQARWDYLQNMGTTLSRAIFNPRDETLQNTRYPRSVYARSRR